MTAQSKTHPPELSLDRRPMKIKMSRSYVLMVVSALAFVAMASVVLRRSMVSAEREAAEQRVVAAYSASQAGLALEYAEREANRQQALAAESERWTALAQHYAEAEANRERSWDAYRARLNGLAAHYGQRVMGGLGSQGAWDTVAARYAAQAVHLALETGDHDLLPACMAPRTMALIPSLGDDTWRTTIPTCK
jgi:hypothetical protein